MSSPATSAVGTNLPAPGTYAIDPAHSSVDFTVRHLGLSKVRGRFGVFSGTVVVAEDPTASSVDVQIDAASFDTGNPDRDAHVKSADFLDVDAHPALTYVSRSVRQVGGEWVVEGDLGIAGTVRPVALAVEFSGSATDPWGGSRIAFAASTEIDRDEFGISWNQAMETGGFLLGKKVKIDIEVQAVAQ